MKDWVLIIINILPLISFAFNIFLIQNIYCDNVGENHTENHQHHSQVKKLQHHELMIPRIISKNTEHTVLEGRSKVDFVCEVRSSATTETNIQWKATHFDIDELEILSPSRNIRILRFPTVVKDQMGNYTCLASNTYGNTKLNFKLIVVEIHHGNFEIYAYFVGCTMASILIILSCSFCCGRYCCSKKAFNKIRKSPQTITDSEQQNEVTYRR